MSEQASTTTTTRNPTEDDIKIRRMLEACTSGDMKMIQDLVEEDSSLISQQEYETGRSPLMIAAQVGNRVLCQHLLEGGAPWNAIDRHGQCAGNYATDNEHWDIVQLFVDWGTRSELILGQIQKTQRQQVGMTSILAPASHVYEESSTKPDYLQHTLRYNADETALLDGDNDAVMMEWERPLMQAHAQILMEEQGTSTSSTTGGATTTTSHRRRRRVLNVGFGMGIIDGILQEQYQPSLHMIIEAHPDVYQKMLNDKWDEKPNVKIYHGRWQDVIPQFIQDGIEVDAIFFDTYGEHSFDMEDFHTLMGQILSKPRGIYSFFNGLAPDNLFFHGVACNVVKLQLDKLGFDVEFLQCQIETNNDKVWDGIRRKYWHNRDVYYLPRVTWNDEFLGRKTKKVEQDSISNQHDEMMDVDYQEGQATTKRQRRVDG